MKIEDGDRVAVLEGAGERLRVRVAVLEGAGAVMEEAAGKLLAELADERNEARALRITPNDLRGFCGHKTEAMAEHYAHVSPEDKTRLLAPMVSALMQEE